MSISSSMTRTTGWVMAPPWRALHRLRGLRWDAAREERSEAGSVELGRVNVDGASVREHDLLGDEQPQAEAARPRLLPVGARPERLEDEGEDLGRDGAPVADLETHTVRSAPVDGDHHRSIRQPVVESFAEQVRPQLPQPVHVPLPDWIPLDLDGHRAAGDEVVELVERQPADLRQIRPLRRQREPPP